MPLAGVKAICQPTSFWVKSVLTLLGIVEELASAAGSLMVCFRVLTHCPIRELFTVCWLPGSGLG
jgi:hypothetical protein